MASSRSRPIEWPPASGARCWVDNRNTRLSLPDGLQDREEVQFVGLEGKRVRVRRGDGKEFALDAIQVHVPSEIQINGEWLPETHPAVIQSMRDWIAILREKGAGSRSAEQIEDIIEDLEWVIRRNGG